MTIMIKKQQGIMIKSLKKSKRPSISECTPPAKRGQLRTHVTYEGDLQGEMRRAILESQKRKGVGRGGKWGGIFRW